MKRTGLIAAIIMAMMMAIPSMASEGQDFIIDEQEIIIDEEEYSAPADQEDTESLPVTSPETNGIVIESIEEVPTQDTEANIPTTLAATEFSASMYIGESTTLEISMTSNLSITLVSADDSIATASVTGTSTKITSSGITYGRTITINGYKEGTTTININSGSSTIGIINVEVLVETENIGTQHVDSTYTASVVSTYDQNYSVDTDAVSIKSISTSKKTTTTSVNGNSTTVTTYTSTITLSLNEVGTYDFNIIGSSTGRMKNFKADVVAHIWNDYYTVDVEPTTTSEGSESIHCSVCAEIDPDTVTVLPMKEKTDISELTIELDSSTLTYDGTEKKPGVTIYDGSTKLTSSDYDVTYSNNINAGMATVTITCKGDNYTGETQKTFTIEKANVSNCTITLAETKYVYDGSAKTPAVTSVKNGSTTLTSSEDYTVSYSNNTNAGAATVKITGTGNYTGTATTTFVIEGINLSNASVTLSATSYTYDGSAKKPSVTVKYGNITLTSGTDYTVSYSNNTNAGTASVTITGKGNYTGTFTKNFTINKANQTVTATASSSSIVAGKTTTIKASGKGTITYSSSNTSVATVSSSGTVTGKSAGTATITVKAAGNSNYNSGSTTVKITVTAASSNSSTSSSSGSSSSKTNTSSSGSGSTASSVKKGSSYIVGDFIYKVTKAPASGTGTVTVRGLSNLSLTKAVIPAKVTIQGRSFKVTKIAAKAFQGNARLKSVTIGKNVTTIGKKAFYKCSKLKTINIKSKVLTSVGKNAFKGIKSNAKIKVPSSKLSAYKTLLNGKGLGSKVKITK